MMLGQVQMSQLDAVFVVPVNVERTEYAGVITVNQAEYDFHVKWTPHDRSSERKLVLDTRLAESAAPSLSMLGDRLRLSRTPESFFKEMHQVLENVAQDGGRNMTNSVADAKRSALLLKEMEGCGLENITDVDEQLSSFQFTTKQDALLNATIGTIGLKFPIDFPSRAPTVHLEAPAMVVDEIQSKYDALWPSRRSVLSASRLATECVSDVVARYSLLWKSLRDIDEHCHVLEPVPPTFLHAHRRIALPVGNASMPGSASIHVAVDVAANAKIPSVPTISFMGRPEDVAPFRSALNRNVHMWNALDAGQTLRERLQVVLECTFPTPRAATSETAVDAESECGVCYSYRLGTSIPNASCASCKQLFHEPCLINWFQGLPNCRQTIDMIHGDCPYCGASMAVCTTATANS